MKVYAKAYKTYEGARRRLLHEKACGPKGCVWDIRVMANGFRVARTTNAEHQRNIAVAIAKQAFGLDEKEDSLS